MLNDFLYNIDANTMLLALLFVIFFVLINFALSKTIKDRGTSSIISFCVSLLAVYGLNRTSLDLTGFFSGIGLTDKIIYSIIPIVIVAGLAFMIWKLKLSWTLILTGAFLIIMSLTSLIYEKTWVLAIGIVLLVLGIILLIRSKRKRNATQTSPNQSAPSSGGKSMLWYLLIILILVGIYAVISKLITFIIISAVAILILLIIIFKRK